MEPNVGRPKGLGNISDIRCRICRHWFIIARTGLRSVFSVRVHLSNVWSSASVARRRPWVLLGPASIPPIREHSTEPAFVVAGCICASPWLPPLLSGSSLGAHPVAGDVWRPPRVGERAEGVVDGKGEGDGCFVRVYLILAKERKERKERKTGKLKNCPPGEANKGTRASPG